MALLGSSDPLPPTVRPHLDRAENSELHRHLLYRLLTSCHRSCHDDQKRRRIALTGMGRHASAAASKWQASGKGNGKVFVKVRGQPS